MHQLAQTACLLQARRGRQERMLLPVVNRIGDKRASRFAKHVLLGHAANLHRDRHIAHQLDHLMIQEGDASFDRMRHFHPIAEHVQQVVGQHRLGPQVQRLVHRLAPFELTSDVEPIEKYTERIALGKLRHELGPHQPPVADAIRRPNFKPRRDVAQRAADTVHRQRLTAG